MLTLHMRLYMISRAGYGLTFCICMHMKYFAYEYTDSPELNV